MAGETDHTRRVRDEFTRQSQTIPASAMFGDERTLERIAHAVAAGPAENVLDVACGPGIVARRLARDAREVVGVDVTEAMRVRARQLCAEAGLTNVRFEEGSAEALPFPPDSFDAVVSRLALHHFADPGKALDEKCRVVRAAGRVVITDIVSSEDPDESRVHNALETLRDPSHIRMLPRSELRAMLEARGLRILSEDGWTIRREFDEWIAITRSPERRAPLLTLMRELAERKSRAGIGLRIDGDQTVFDHHWVALVARPA